MTQKEILETFSERIKEIAQEMGMSETDFIEKMRFQYNGFCFTPYLNVTLYNPFSMLLFLSKGRSENYWFQTGPPTEMGRRMK